MINKDEAKEMVSMILQSSGAWTQIERALGIELKIVNDSQAWDDIEEYIVMKLQHMHAQEQLYKKLNNKNYDTERPGV